MTSINLNRPFWVRAFWTYMISYDRCTPSFEIAPRCFFQDDIKSYVFKSPNIVIEYLVSSETDTVSKSYFDITVPLSGLFWG